MAIPVEAFGHHGSGFESFRGSFPAPLTSPLQAFSSFASRKWCKEGHSTSCRPGQLMLQAREEKTLVLRNSMLVEKRDQNPSTLPPPSVFLGVPSFKLKTIVETEHS